MKGRRVAQFFICFLPSFLKRFSFILFVTLFHTFISVPFVASAATFGKSFRCAGKSCQNKEEKEKLSKRPIMVIGVFVPL